MMEIHEVRQRKDALYITLKFTKGEVDKLAGYNVGYVFQLPNSLILKNLLHGALKKLESEE